MEALDLEAQVTFVFGSQKFHLVPTEGEKIARTDG